jgi:hypothetical protein
MLRWTLCFSEMRLKGQGEDEGVVLYFVEGNNSLIGVRKTPVGIRHVLWVGKIILEAGVFTAYERMTKRQVMYFLGCNYMRSSTGFSSRIIYPEFFINFDLQSLKQKVFSFHVLLIF